MMALKRCFGDSEYYLSLQDQLQRRGRAPRETTRLVHRLQCSTSEGESVLEMQPAGAPDGRLPPQERDAPARTVRKRKGGPCKWGTEDPTADAFQPADEAVVHGVHGTGHFGVAKDLQLPLILLAYRTAITSCISTLMKGRELQTPAELLFGQPPYTEALAD
ncbi:UNVERIFIED_CONTAM: hypothetical protein FKN15_012042 [Acipenser sinensis]